jgi:hypothetical protein
MSTETTEDITPYTLANQLSREVFSSLFPDDPDASKRGRRDDIPAELLIPRVEKATDVGVDDILVVIEDVTYRELSLRTARDIVMRQPRTRLVRVGSTTAKSIKVKDVDLCRGDWRTDLAEFGKVYDYTETRLMIPTASREVGRLGTVTELRQKLLEHPRFAEWQAARTAAYEQHEADEAELRAQREAREARLAPVKAAVEALNSIAREQLVTMWVGDVRAVSEWLAENDFARMQVYIAGLSAIGRITDEQHAEALRHLDTIIEYAKGEK